MSAGHTSTHDWTAELTAYIDGELPAESAAQLEARLKEDAELRSLEQRLRRTLEQLRALPSPEASPALRRAVLSRIDEPTLRERVGDWLSWRGVLPVATLGAAATVMVLALDARDGARQSELAATLAVDDEQLVVAQNLEVIEDLDVLGLESTEDFELVAQLDTLGSLQ